MVYKTNMARAYVNHGRWVADCPIECGSALNLDPGQILFACVECHSISHIDWPTNADEIWEALQERPFNKVRHWYPRQHDLAVRAGIPHGQTPEELRQEARDHMEEDA
jgi:hypothetical protein